MEQSEPESEESEADAIEAAGFGVADVRRIRDVAHDHGDGEDADGDIDVKRPAPGIGVGEPAAESGTEYGSDDNTESKERHGKAAFFRWERLEKDRLRYGL